MTWPAWLGTPAGSTGKGLARKQADQNVTVARAPVGTKKATRERVIWLAPAAVTSFAGVHCCRMANRPHHHFRHPTSALLGCNFVCKVLPLTCSTLWAAQAVHCSQHSTWVFGSPTDFFDL